MSDVPYASLAMYPFEPLQPAWERLWSAVHELAPWTPASLRWDGDAHDHWTDPDCLVAQACGWPVVTSLHGHVEVVGAFTLALDDGDGHRYRSVVMANRPVALADARRRAGDRRGQRAGQPVRLGQPARRRRRPGRCVARAGAVDRRSRREPPRPARRPRRRGVDRRAQPRVRAPATTPISRSGSTRSAADRGCRAFRSSFEPAHRRERVDELRARDRRMRSASAELAAARDELLLDGFVPLDDRDYEPLLDLARHRRSRSDALMSERSYRKFHEHEPRAEGGSPQRQSSSKGESSGDRERRPRDAAEAVSATAPAPTGHGSRRSGRSRSPACATARPRWSRPTSWSRSTRRRCASSPRSG